MKTLIIYSLVPESEYYFILPDEDLLPEWKEMLNQANGKMANVDDLNEGMRWLMSATSSQKSDCDPEIDEKYHSCLIKYKFELSKDDVEITGPFSRVYVSGFYL